MGWHFEEWSYSMTEQCQDLHQIQHFLFHELIVKILLHQVYPRSFHLQPHKAEVKQRNEFIDVYLILEHQLISIIPRFDLALLRLIIVRGAHLMPLSVILIPQLVFTILRNQLASIIIMPFVSFIPQHPIVSFILGHWLVFIILNPPTTFSWPLLLPTFS